MNVFKKRKSELHAACDVLPLLEALILNFLLLLLFRASSSRNQFFPSILKFLFDCDVKHIPSGGHPEAPMVAGRAAGCGQR